VPLSNGKGGRSGPKRRGQTGPFMRTRLRVLDDMHGRHDLRHLDHLHDSSPPSVGRLRPYLPEETVYGREILSVVDSLRDAEIPRGGAFCSSAADYPAAPLR